MCLTVAESDHRQGLDWPPAAVVEELVADRTRWNFIEPAAANSTAGDPEAASPSRAREGREGGRAPDSLRLSLVSETGHRIIATVLDVVGLGRTSRRHSAGSLCALGPGWSSTRITRRRAQRGPRLGYRQIEARGQRFMSGCT